MMAKKQFQAESKRLLEIMINSIYTQKEIFLRELLSNASDAIDKIYYQALTDDNLTFDAKDYYIKIEADKPSRTLKVIDTGIGMTKEEMENNLGVIAESGSLAFKKENETEDNRDLIGQFGVGFYSAFMVADKVTVKSRALGSDEAYKWESEGADGYTIEPCEKDDVGTEMILQIKENGDQEQEEAQYDDFLDEQRLKDIVKTYSDFIRYPIKMDITEQKPKEDNEEEFEEVVEEQTVNSMVPLWRKNKNELSDEDYENFYKEKNYGFDKPLTYLHINADGTVSYQSILYIPEQVPPDYYTKEYEKGLELYSNGVLIMSKCADLLPDYFAFVKGMVDSEDLSLNVSREMLQHDRQLNLIAKNIKNKIKSELKRLMKDDRPSYETFYQAFGRQLKFGAYDNFGANKKDLEDLLMFYSSTEKKLVSFDDYVSRMPEEQSYIYYASGDSVNHIDKLPQTELVADKGYEILYFTEDVDEFLAKTLGAYQDKEFKSVASDDLGFEEDESDKQAEENDENKALFDKMKELLSDQVTNVKASKRLKSHPVCLSAEGEISIEMEKTLQSMPNGQQIQADKALEINVGHEVFRALKDAYENDHDQLARYANVLYNQALLIEGLPVGDPVAFTDDICKVMVS